MSRRSVVAGRRSAYRVSDRSADAQGQPWAAPRATRTMSGEQTIYLPRDAPWPERRTIRHRADHAHTVCTPLITSPRHPFQHITFFSYWRRGFLVTQLAEVIFTRIFCLIPCAIISFLVEEFGVYGTSAAEKCWNETGQNNNGSNTIKNWRRWYMKY